MTHKRIDLPPEHDTGPYDIRPYARIIDDGRALIITDASGDMVYLTRLQFNVLARAMGWQS